MNLRTGLAGLVALVWAIVAMLIGNGVGGPPRLACALDYPAAPSERFISYAGRAASPLGRAAGPAPVCTD